MLIHLFHSVQCMWHRQLFLYVCFGVFSSIFLFLIFHLSPMPHNLSSWERLSVTALIWSSLMPLFCSIAGYASSEAQLRTGVSCCTTSHSQSPAWQGWRKKGRLLSESLAENFSSTMKSHNTSFGIISISRFLAIFSKTETLITKT